MNEKLALKRMKAKLARHQRGWELWKMALM